MLKIFFIHIENPADDRHCLLVHTVHMFVIFEVIENSNMRKYFYKTQSFQNFMFFGVFCGVDSKLVFVVLIVTVC
jgi:hypothetical protein